MKLANRIFNYIKDNVFYFILILLFLVMYVIKVPYDVEMPGGIIELKDRIKIDDNRIDTSGSYGMAYVNVVQGSIPYVLGGLIVDDWDVVKSEDNLYPNESIADASKRNKIYLEQSIDMAMLAALKEADREYEIVNKKNNVLYIDKDADTTLKVGDSIVSCEGKEINDVSEITKTIDEKKYNDVIEFVVLRNNREVKATARVVKVDKKKRIGLLSATTFDIDTDSKIVLDTKSSESGPSGGMMMALAIYEGLTNKDLANGRKIVGTGTIDMDGNVGDIGGIKYKVIGAYKKGLDVFFVPEGNYKEALKVKKEKKYDFEIVSVKNLKDAIRYLEGDAYEE